LHQWRNNSRAGPGRVTVGSQAGAAGPGNGHFILCYLLDAEEGGSAVFIPAAAKKESQTFHIQAFIIIMVAPLSSQPLEGRLGPGTIIGDLLLLWPQIMPVMEAK
jgi:hypothetical protein